MRVGVEADDGRVRQKTRDVFIRTLRAENLVVHARQKIPGKTADGLRGAQNGLADAVRIEFDQRPVALLNFDNAVLNWHHRGLYRKRANTQCRFNATDEALILGEIRRSPTKRATFGWKWLALLGWKCRTLFGGEAG